MNKTEIAVVPDEIRKKLAFQRGLLTLLTLPKETLLYRPMIQKALEDIDELMDKASD